MSSDNDETVGLYIGLGVGIPVLLGSIFVAYYTKGKFTYNPWCGPAWPVERADGCVTTGTTADGDQVHESV